jgi:hypothetical protein
MAISYGRSSLARFSLRLLAYAVESNPKEKTMQTQEHTMEVRMIDGLVFTDAVVIAQLQSETKCRRCRKPTSEPVRVGNADYCPTCTKVGTVGRMVG